MPQARLMMLLASVYYSYSPLGSAVGQAEQTMHEAIREMSYLKPTIRSFNLDYKYGDPLTEA